MLESISIIDKTKIKLFASLYAKITGFLCESDLKIYNVE